eukprot:1550361-Amphidinium_carterae.1
MTSSLFNADPQQCDLCSKESAHTLGYKPPAPRSLTGPVDSPCLAWPAGKTRPKSETCGVWGACSSTWQSLGYFGTVFVPTMQWCFPQSQTVQSDRGFYTSDGERSNLSWKERICNCACNGPCLLYTSDAADDTPC